MQKKPMVAAATGLVGLMASGLAVSLLAFPADAGPSEVALKRDEDTTEVVLVDDDNDDNDDNDDDEATDRDVRARDTVSATRTRTGRSAVSRTGNSGDASRTGARSGRDDSRSGRAVRDWTNDGPGKMKRDWSANRTNDRTRNNSRR